LDCLAASAYPNDYQAGEDAARCADGREILTQEDLLEAYGAWPATGVPANCAWMMETAKHRALDHLRRGRMIERKHDMLAWDRTRGEQKAMPDGVRAEPGGG